jgi:hypothetical protein
MSSIRTGWKPGTIIDGSYYCGYWRRLNYYMVVNISKGGIPQLQQLESETVSLNSTGSESTTVIRLLLPIVKIGGVIKNVRWSRNNEQYGFKDEFNIKLDSIHEDGSTFTEKSYY